MAKAPFPPKADPKKKKKAPPKPPMKGKTPPGKGGGKLPPFMNPGAPSF